MRKKAVFLIMIGAILASLTGCFAKMPTMAVDGTPWSRDWIMLGGVLGVEGPGHGMTLRDDKGARGMYYVAWSVGEAQPHVTASGEETNVYDAQMVLLLTSCDTAEEARMDVDDWLALAADTYTISDTAQETYNGQEFTVLTYAISSETSLYARGVSAFAAFDTWAVSVEFACQDDFEEDAQALVADVLNHFHYVAK